MIESLIALSAIIGGMLAHRTENIVIQFPKRWELLSRYIIGYLTCGLFFAALLARLNRQAVRDGVLSYSISGAFVGLGVAFSHWKDDEQA